MKEIKTILAELAIEVTDDSEVVEKYNLSTFDRIRDPLKKSYVKFTTDSTKKSMNDIYNELLNIDSSLLYTSELLKLQVEDLNGLFNFYRLRIPGEFSLYDSNYEASDKDEEI